jgi:hypothetical protein
MLDKCCGKSRDSAVFEAVLAAQFFHLMSIDSQTPHEHTPEKDTQKTAEIKKIYSS